VKQEGEKEIYIKIIVEIPARGHLFERRHEKHVYLIPHPNLNSHFDIDPDKIRKFW
jgi:hypothetical protein